MKNVKRLIVTFLAGALVFSFTACSTQNNAQTGDSTDNIKLTISAAASLKNAMEELTPMYEEASKGQTLTFNYGGLRMARRRMFLFLLHKSRWTLWNRRGFWQMEPVKIC